MNCAKCKTRVKGKFYTCDILCITTHNKIKVVNLCKECFNLMMDNQDKFLNELKLNETSYLIDIEMIPK